MYGLFCIHLPLLKLLSLSQLFRDVLKIFWVTNEQWGHWTRYSINLIWHLTTREVINNINVSRLSMLPQPSHSPKCPHTHLSTVIGPLVRTNMRQTQRSVRVMLVVLAASPSFLLSVLLRCVCEWTILAMIAMLVTIITDSGTIEYVAKLSHGQYSDRNNLYLETVVQDFP